MSNMKHKLAQQEGVALIFVLIALTFLLMASLLFSQSVLTTKRFTDSATNRVTIEEGAKAGIDAAIEVLWTQFEEDSDSNLDLELFREYVDGLEETLAHTEDLNGNGKQDINEQDANGDGKFNVAEATVILRDRALANGVKIDQVTATRRDDLYGTNLVLRSTASRFGETRTAEQVIRVGGTPLDLTDFAVFGSNLNCVFCHTEVRPLDLLLRQEGRTEEDVLRLKIAGLDALGLRLSESNSHVAGTVYTRGGDQFPQGIYDAADPTDAITDSELARGSFRGYEFDHIDETLKLDAQSEPIEQTLRITPEHDGRPRPGGSLYVDYPEYALDQVDGLVPSRVPPPFPDHNDNRLVDNLEFDPFLNMADGAITGSEAAFGIPLGQRYTPAVDSDNRPQLPGASNSAASDLRNGFFDGQLILLGTNEHPIEIDGMVAVNGDLIIQGPVKGTGQLMVRGNTYIIGDLTYADAPGEFGAAEDGTQNALALTSGGNILIGDFLSMRGLDDTGQDTAIDPQQGLFIDYRSPSVIQGITANETKPPAEHLFKDSGYWADSNLDGQADVVDIGSRNGGTSLPLQYNFDGEPIKGITQRFEEGGFSGFIREPLSEDQMSFASAQMMLFNQSEYMKAQADPEYRPRYYRNEGGADVWRYDITEPGAEDRTFHYDLAQPGLHLVQPDPRKTSSLNLGPMAFTETGQRDDTNGVPWIENYDDALRSWWHQNEMRRPADGIPDPMLVDAFLYTNNAVFGFAPTKALHNSEMYGQMLLRGGVLATDIGILATGEPGQASSPGLQIYFDRRIAGLFEVVDLRNIGFKRKTFRYAILEE